MTLTEINKKERIPFINIATDYECIPFWNETKPDYFIIPSKLLIKSFLKKGISKKILMPLGIPVSSNYKNITNLNLLPTDKDIVLITSGSMGFGNLVSLINKLLLEIPDVYFVVICGNNKKLEESLLKINNNNLKVVGFTKDMNYYLKYSNIVVTKPGGLTSTEVAIINKPFIHMMPIPGVENYNANFFETNKMSLKATNEEEVIKDIQLLLKDKKLQNKLCKNQLKYINSNSARDLVKFIISKY